MKNMTLLAALLEEHDMLDELELELELELGELYREMGLYDAAVKALSQCPENDRGTTNKVIKQMIEEAVIAPVRFHM